VFRLALAFALVLSLGAGVAPLHSAHADSADQVDSIAGNLMCQCGCGLVVSACGDTMECSIGDQMKAIIRKKLAESKAGGEIIGYFQELYGEAVLAAPSKSGFNLTAWVTPFAAIAFAGVALGGFVWLWVSRRGPPPERPRGERTGKKERNRYAERVERELETLE
jgi:cytochrome c-type biogenesis protein CcmH